jgi:hypothetical protein
MELTFDTRDNEKQKECAKAWVDNSVRDIVYGGSKGSAKSFTGCSLIFGDAFIYPETHYFIARAKLSDVRKYTIPSIHEVFQKWEVDQKYFKYNGQDNYFQLYNKSRVYLLEAKYLPSDPFFSRFGSMQMTRGWLEEAGEFQKAAKDNLLISTGRWKNHVYKINGKILQTCNPTKNYLYQDYYLKNKNKSLEPEKKFIQAFPTDNKMLADGYLEILEDTLTSTEKDRLLYGNWEYSNDQNALCAYESILDIFTNDHVKKGRKYISADLAMQGRDCFIAGHWEGLIGYVDIDLSKSTGKEIEQKLKSLKNQHGVPNSKIIADSDGLGSYLESYIENIVPFHGGARPLKVPSNNQNRNSKFIEYDNLKSQCAWHLAKLINEGKIKIVCTEQQKEKIIQELEICLKREYLDADHKKRSLIKKDKMKSLLGRSPDYLDWLLMRMYFELKQPHVVVL